MEFDRVRISTLAMCNDIFPWRTAEPLWSKLRRCKLPKTCKKTSTHNLSFTKFIKSTLFSFSEFEIFIWISWIRTSEKKQTSTTWLRIAFPAFSPDRRASIWPWRVMHLGWWKKQWSREMLPLQGTNMYPLCVSPFLGCRWQMKVYRDSLLKHVRILVVTGILGGGRSNIYIYIYIRYKGSWEDDFPLA